LPLGVYEIGIDNSFFENTKDDTLIGGIVYNTPVGRNTWSSISPMLNVGEVFELTRLWIKDGTPKNIESWAIGQSFDWLKKNRPDIKCLVSYADPMAGHLGIIYQATNWLYQQIYEDDYAENLYYYSFDEGKTWTHPKTMFDKYNVGTLNKLKQIIPKPFWVKKIRNKHRYIYILTDKKEKRKILATLKYPPQPYPKTINNVDTTITKYE
jgi:hypothetical protein